MPDILYTDFTGGELSHKVVNRTDLKLAQVAMDRVTNFLPETQGPLRYRNGCEYIMHTRLNQTAHFLKFEFNDAQSYQLEFTDQKVRFYTNEGVAVEDPVTITGITTASEAVVTAASHGYSDGDEVYISEVDGMESINGRFFIVSDSATNTFKIKDVFGDYIDTTSYDAYVSGGTSKRVYEVTTPYTEASDITKIRAAQDGDVIYLAHPSFRPGTLTRTGSVSWTYDATFGITSPTGYDFINTDYPGDVAFSVKRLVYSKVETHPLKVFISKAPSNDGTTNYNDFTVGTNADDGVVFPLSSTNGKVDEIRWIASLKHYIVVGTYATISLLRGDTSEEPITGVSYNRDVIDSDGVEDVEPVFVGSTLVYVQRNGLSIKSVEYEALSDGLVTVDRSIASDTILSPGVVRLEYQQGRPDLVWALKSDGTLAAMTFKPKEEVSGYSRHISGGSGLICDINVIAQPNNYDILAICVSRTINGNSVKYVEYLTQDSMFPVEYDYYTGEDPTEDDANYRGVLYEWQKSLNRLDCSLTYDGKFRGVNADATLTVSGTTITSDKAVFKTTDVGLEIREIYTGNGETAGRYKITGFTSDTEVQVSETLAWATSSKSPGEWAFAVKSVTGLDHLEGETVYATSDGGAVAAQEVTSGEITFEEFTTYGIIGYKYRGFVAFYNLGNELSSGPTYFKKRKITEIVIKFFKSLGMSVGTTLDKIETINRPSETNYLDRCPTLIDAPVEIEVVPDNQSLDKKLFLVQDNPQPCMVQALQATYNLNIKEGR